MYLQLTLKSFTKTRKHMQRLVLSAVIYTDAACFFEIDNFYCSLPESTIQQRGMYYLLFISDSNILLFWNRVQASNFPERYHGGWNRHGRRLFRATVFPRGANNSGDGPYFTYSFLSFQYKHFDSGQYEDRRVLVVL